MPKHNLGKTLIPKLSGISSNADDRALIILVLQIRMWSTNAELDAFR